jgi:hypothetical protein
MSDAAKQTDAPKAADAPIEFPVSFGRNPHYKAIHSNGVWFSTDPEGNLHMMFYNDYFPTPKKITLLLDRQGHVVGENEAKRETVAGTIRELEVDVIFSINAATEFHRMLGENLAAIAKGQPK